MNELSVFVSKIKNILTSFNSTINIEQARFLIKELNEFLYTNYENIGTTTDDLAYFSDFHKYWEVNHKEILNARIDDEACCLVADELHNVFLTTNGKIFEDVYDTKGLSDEEICRIRLLTANQDFRGSRDFADLVDIYNSDNSVFDEKVIFDNPEDFLKNIKITNLSQNDKRVQYAKSISNFLISQQSSPFNIIKKYENDVLKFKQALVSFPHSGYGNKKADMFIRDMIVLGVWKNVLNFDKINVASDVNTIKVALRTGILKTEIPLVSSFLDIFCYQYSYIDEMNAKAWRRVWEIWRDKYPDSTINSPCLLDYFVYNVIGKQFCRENLYIYKGEDCEHTFKWHSARNKTCQECYSKGILGKKAHLVGKVKSCVDKDAVIFYKYNNFAKTYNMTNCPFVNVCNKNQNRDLEPPKSISIWGQTGWTSAYTRKNKGGGGLMA